MRSPFFFFFQVKPVVQTDCSFGIVHYAGTVTYNSTLLAKKNKDAGHMGRSRIIIEE